VRSGTGTTGVELSAIRCIKEKARNHGEETHAQQSQQQQIKGKRKLSNEAKHQHQIFSAKGEKKSKKSVRSACCSG
jgi:hypothetical protein